MPNENPESTAVLERPSPPEAVEFTGKHIEAAFTFRANYHKQRILEKFGAETELPPLPKSDMGTTLEASEKRFQKAYDLLQRELPLDIPEFDTNLTRDHVIAIADNLVWKGIENSLITSHLIEINKVLKHMKANGKDSQVAAELRGRGKALKSAVLEDNHFYRDFFESDLAAELNFNSPTEMKKLLKRASITDADVEELSRGISLEIASSRYLEKVCETGMQDAIVRYGSSDEDAHGGDLVVINEDKILHIDVKKAPPHNLSEAEILHNYHFRADREKQLYKAVVWAETRDAVADDSFRLTDPKLKHSLEQVLNEIR